MLNHSSRDIGGLEAQAVSIKIHANALNANVWRSLESQFPEIHMETEQPLTGTKERG